ncbi:MAG: signal peptidase I [Firmicutes bacterium]|nr:signal peptidase I [Bacillota bacterium]
MRKTEQNDLWEWIKSILVAVVLALVIRAFLVEVFLVQGESMLPTLKDRERLLVSKVQYYYRDPEPGEIIVFKVSSDRDFIKRVIATAGDEVRVDYDGVYVNGVKLQENYVLEKEHEKLFGPEVVPEGYVFVMGDNRNNSMDSRSIGFVKLEEVKGKAMFVFWPLSNMRLLRHS